MSLMLVFRSKTIHTVGPLGSFRLDGEALRTVDGAIIAKHEQNVWQVNRRHYPRLECQGKVSIWFERGQSIPEMSRRFGPHEALALYDGVAYIAKHVFASLNPEAGNWYCHEDGRYWRVMAIEAAG